MTQTLVTLFHVVGDADLGLRSGEDRSQQLAELRKDPRSVLYAVRGDEADRLIASPLMLTVDWLQRHGYTVDAVVLLGTQQDPPHPSDTLPIARALADLDPQQLSEVVAGHPARLTVEPVSTMSLDGFRYAVRSYIRSQRPTALLATTLSGGSKAGFLGTVTELVSTGRWPLVVEINAGDAAHTDAPIDMPKLDPVAWLVRRRMWAALEKHPDLDDAQRAAFGALRRYDDHAPLREMPRRLDLEGLSPREQDRVVSELITRRSMGDPHWSMRLVRLMEELTITVFNKLDPPDKAMLAPELAKWRATSPRQDFIKNAHDGAVLWDAATRSSLWSQRPKDERPQRLRQWLDGDNNGFNALSVYKATKSARHDGAELAPTRQKKADRFIVRLLHDPSASVRDPLPEFVDSTLGFGRPLTLGEPCTLGIRLLGDREGVAIRKAVDRHLRSISHRDASTSESLEFASVMTDSPHPPTTRRIVLSDPHHAEATSKEVAAAITTAAREIEASSARVVTKIALYLGQGTKQMNLGLLLGALPTALALACELTIHEVAAVLPADGVAPAGTQVLDSDPISPTSFIGVSSILAAAASSIDLFAFAQAKQLLEQIPDEQQTPIVLEAQDMVEQLMQRPPGGDLLQVARHAHMWWANRSRLGDSLTTLRLTLLMSSVVPEKDLNSTTPDKRTNKHFPKYPNLDGLWSARNSVVHRYLSPDRPTSYSLEGIIREAAAYKKQAPPTASLSDLENARQQLIAALGHESTQRRHGS